MEQNTGPIDPKLIESLRLAAPEGRISCQAARDLAKKLGVPVRSVGAACNALKIKIKSCELGCFD